LFGIWGDSYIELGREQDTAANSYNAKGTATNFGSGLGVFAASHTYFFNSNMRLQTTASFQAINVSTVFDSVHSLVPKPIYRQNQVQEKFSVNQKIMHKFSSRLHMSAGYIYDFVMIDYIDSAYAGSTEQFQTGIDINEHMQLMQTYLQGQYKISPFVSCYAGVHMQHFDVNSQMVVEPRLGIEFILSDVQKLKLAYGVHNQTQVKEIYYHQFKNSVTQQYEYSNKDVKFTRNNHYILSYVISINDFWRIQSELYYQFLDNVPISAHMPEYSMINAGADFTVPHIKNLENSGEGYNAGIEMTIERPIHKGYYVLATASLFDSKYIDYSGVNEIPHLITHTL
jgi:hypothetical protein